ncbi:MULTISPECIES: S-layer homology domain-containing protein [Lysinibacillus]|uniref:S-layer homology domain-containing protein n=1 Tax=Lysinibacillus TaxID=400634 RepID=UPI00214C7175|nr:MULTISPECIES: S-layer homology domain-containing protein [Lysinibacillus]UUV23270.1 S-layer homology domain-containing protein [Lysinibacillus sp. FN11]UYB46135.1 S-layer homology domain-containing protein [Lysinibacillus capsici]
MKRIMYIVTIIFLFTSSAFVQNVNAKTVFSDVSKTHNAYKEIMFLAEKGIAKEFPDGTFRPSANITRLQAVQMLLLSKGVTDFSDVSNPRFADVRPGQDGYEEIAKAVELGIINGKVNTYGQKVFEPSGNLTRGQMAKIFSIAYEFEGYADKGFSDVPVSHWASEYVQLLANNKITFGYANGKFGVNDFITRSQFSLMMARTLDESFRVEPEAPKPPTEPTNLPTGGTTYLDGWTAPVLQSKWSSDPAKNFVTLQNELGFTEGGHFFNITGAPYAITVNGGDSVNEVTFKFTMWDGDAGGYLKEAYRVPIVAKELFKLYFGDDAQKVWDYFNNNDIPEEFTANGRKVKATYIDIDGSMYIQVGKKK